MDSSRNRVWHRRAVPLGVSALLIAVSLSSRATAEIAAASDAASNSSTSVTLSTEALAARARPSLVTLTARGRDGSGEGVGTGFVIDPSGLIATSLHVVGEARPVTARLASGEELEITGVHAFDRTSDLAVLRVASTNLPSLLLGDSAVLPAGAEVVAMGNPLGLENSVVAGVLSGRRTLESVEMLQVAIPIEPGNSGGPLMDRAGRVQGIVNAKSFLTRNLGFATPVNLLKPLLEHPNPVPFERWVRTGRLDTNRWETRLGAQWRQRSGRVQVDGYGTGFGGRSYVMQRNPAPEVPYEVTVTVRLKDESGAAGLIFGGSEEGTHYGFYPTGGQLRLTAFEGPEVNDWRILGTVPSVAYRPGDWNVLRVRIEPTQIRCWVNGTEVFSENDAAMRGRRVGLAKFRNTSAEFRAFACAAEVAPPVLPNPSLLGTLASGRDPDPATLSELRAHPGAARLLLSDRARTLEREALRLRELSTRLHREQVRDQLVAELSKPENEVDLPYAALLVARLDDPDLDVDVYRRQLDELGSEVRARMSPGLTGSERVELLRKFLFEENGFHGSRHDYSNRANSRLNEVLDDREGLPITLSLVFLALADRAGIGDVSGLPLPGHFLVRYAPPGQPPRLLDVFNGGRAMTHAEADELGSEFSQVPVRSELMPSATKRAMMVRLVSNLQSFTERDEGPGESLRYADLLVAIAGEPAAEAQQRIQRARLRSVTGDLSGAREDLRWVIAAAPPGIDVERLSALLPSGE
ncbi:MAG: transglutaminase family protein [Verrucomicrobiota bacterium]